MAYIKLPRAGLVWAVAIGCLSSSSVAQDVALNEVLYDPVGVNTGFQVVEVVNRGDSPAPLGALGYHLRYQPVAWPFPAGVIVPPGGIVLVHINTVGVNTATDVFTGIAGQRNLRGADSVALFSSNTFLDPAALVDYVEWGAAGQDGEEVAVAAGRWTAETFVDTQAVRPGATLARSSPAPGAASWCADGMATPGAVNDSCTTPFAQSNIKLHEVGYAGPAGREHPFVEVTNAGVRLEDLGGLRVTLGGEGTFSFPSGSLLGLGEIAVVHLGIAGNATDLEFFSGDGTYRDLEPADSVALHLGEPVADPTRIVDFVEWNAPGAPLEAAAVAAGLWAEGTFVDATDRRRTGAVAVFAPGGGVSRWGVDNTPTPARPNDAPPLGLPQVVLNEVLLDPPGIASGRQVVELANRAVDAAFDASGLTLCLAGTEGGPEPVCFSVPEGHVIPPGGFLLVHLHRAGQDTAGEVFTGPLRDLVAGGDGLALALTAEVESLHNLVDYLRWGLETPEIEASAVALGIWPAAGGIPTDALRENASVAYLGTGDDPDSYRVDLTPSLGAANVEPPSMLPFRRGDCNDDGEADISDAVRSFQFLFLGGRHPLCGDACDANDDSSIDISDPVFLLNFLFRGGMAPNQPGSSGPCGLDPGIDELTCDSFVSC